MEKRIVKSLLLSVACLIFLAGRLEYQEDRVIKGYEDRIDILSYYSALIIEGTVQARFVDSLYYNSKSKKTLMTNIQVAVDKVYPSCFSFDTLIVTIPGGWIEGKGGTGVAGHRFHFDMGDRALLFVEFEKRFDRYITYPRGGEYIIGENKIYIPKKNINRRVELDASRIRNILHANVVKREIGRITNSSKLVVKGKIVEHHIKQGICDFDIEKVYKGNINTGMIQITRQPIGTENFMSPRVAYGPRDWEVGATFIMFLKKNDEFYYPFAGNNSLIRVEGDSLSINNINMTYELEELERKIRRALSK